MHRLPHRLCRALRAGAVVLCAALTLAPPVLHAAATVPPGSLAQVPQFLQSPPSPNVFITVDNSGSMVQEILPDMADKPRRMFPIPLADPYNATGDGTPTTDLRFTLSLAGFCHTANVAQLRSASFNLIYYNPRIRYRPWKVADSVGTITTYPNATPSNALFNPVAPLRGGLDLTSGSLDNLTDYTILEDVSRDLKDRLRVRSACGVADSNSGDGSDIGKFALYYNFDTTPSTCDKSSPAASAGDLDCYQRVEITSATANYAIPAGNQRGQSDEPGCTTSTGATTCTYAAELQNFANWFQYYRSRTLLARGAMGNVMADLGPGFRVGLGLINDPIRGGRTTADGFTSHTVRLGVREFTGANRQPWYTLLHNHDVTGSTPSGRALWEVGAYFDWKDDATKDAIATGPWSNDPGAGLAQFATCRQSYHVYSTDGYWNENKGVLFGNDAKLAESADNKNGPEICRPNGSSLLPQCYQYFANAPGATSGAAFDSFGAATSNSLGNPNNRRFYSSEDQSLADIAMYFWYRDLQPNLGNNVTASSADPAFWQHVSTLPVALGFTGTKTAEGDAYLAKLDTGPDTWPTGLDPDGGDPKTADDLWHAAVNSRGRLFLATNPQELSAQLGAALAEIRARSAVGSAAASSTAFLDTGNGIFTAEIAQGTWSGNLYRREIDTTTLDWKTTASDNTTALPRDANNQPYVWRASTQLPAPAARRMFTMRTGSTARDNLVEFLPESGSSGVDATQMADLVSLNGDSATDVINYLRGARDKEQSAVPPGPMRDRPRLSSTVGSLNNVLGTFANSSPTYVKDDDFGFDFLPTATPGRSTYLTFLRANQGSGTAAAPGRKPVIWAGSNEGAFHAFDATAEQATSGRELFAYVPRAVIRNLSQQVVPGYQHRFMVDGVPAAGDAYIRAPGATGTAAWRTVITGSLGAGGRAVFAIDATDPDALDANSVYWEIGESSLTASQYELLGHTLGPVLIARVRDGTTGNGVWVAIFGNGPESDSKRAALWVVNLETGAPIAILDTGNGDIANPNGLSTPAPLYDAKRQLIALYAGDLRGNIWKFDVSGCATTEPTYPDCATPSTTNWNVSFTTTPLFTTRSPANVGPAATRDRPQPIFAKPLLIEHGNGGVLVIVGTGKLISPGDRESEDVQSMYAVWDKPGETAGLGGDFRTSTPRKLVQQAITSLSGSPATYFMTNFGVNYGTTDRGWFFDLGVTYTATTTAVNTNTGNLVTPRERMVTSPLTLGQNLMAQSFIPSVDSCDLAGTSFLFRLEPMTGGFRGLGSFGSNNSGAIALPGSFGLLPFLERLAAGQDPTTRTGLIFSIDTQGGLRNRRVDLGGLGAFRTWRQLLD